MQLLVKTKFNKSTAAKMAPTIDKEIRQLRYNSTSKAVQLHKA